jgi:ankyrin repeat protein
MSSVCCNKKLQVNHLMIIEHRVDLMTFVTLSPSVNTSAEHNYAIAINKINYFAIRHLTRCMQVVQLLSGFISIKFYRSFMSLFKNYTNLSPFYPVLFYLTFFATIIHAMDHNIIIHENDVERTSHSTSDDLSANEESILNKLSIINIPDEHRDYQKNNYLKNMNWLAYNHITLSFENLETLTIIKTFCNVQHPDSGKTLFQLAIDSNNNTLVRTIGNLCLSTLDVNLYDNKGETALHTAIRKNNSTAVSWTLMSNPLKEIVDESLEFAFKYANKRGIEALEKHLQDKFYQNDQLPSLSYEKILGSLQHREFYPQKSPLICFPETFMDAKKTIIEKSINFEDPSLNQIIFFDACANNSVDSTFLSETFADDTFFEQITRNMFPNGLSKQQKKVFDVVNEIKELFNNTYIDTTEKSSQLKELIKNNHELLTKKTECIPGISIGFLQSCAALGLDQDSFFMIIHYFRDDLLGSINKQRREGNTLLHELSSLWVNRPETADMLDAILQLNPNINIQNDKGNTPLHIALNLMNTYFIQKLLILHPDIIIKNGEDTSVLEQALYNQFELTLNDTEQETLNAIGNYALKNCSKEDIKDACTKAYKTLLPDSMNTKAANKIINKWEIANNNLPAMFRNTGILDAAWYLKMRTWYQDEMQDEDEDIMDEDEE